MEPGIVAPYLMRDEQLSSALADARQKLSALQQEESNRLKWPPEMRLTMRLHDNLCQSRDCDFNYQFEKDGVRQMVGIAAEPPQYRQMASQIHQYCEKYACPIYELLNIINLRK